MKATYFYLGGETVGKPTAEELKVINERFAREPLSEDEVFVFSDRMIDNLPTSYYSRIHENLLRKFLEDTGKGIGLLMNHNSRTLPVGRSFAGELKYDSVDSALVPTLYGKYYMRLGINTQQGMSTDDLAKSINAGTVFDTSIGFKAESWTCSLCSHDIRDWRNCDHWPGYTYNIDRGDGVLEEKMCYVDVGIDGEGEILENSLVYAGAAGRATIVGNFSDQTSGVNVGEEQKPMSKLSIVEDIKSVPQDATIFHYYSSDGVVMLTDTEDRNDIAKLRSELQVDEQVKALEQQLADKDSALTEAQGKLATAETEKAQLGEQLSAKEGELAETQSKLAEKDNEVAQLSAQVAELTAKAELADTFRNDLIEQTLSAGVKAQGNAFPREQFGKFLQTLSIDEIKQTKTQFESTFSANFENAKRVTDGKQLSNEQKGEPKSRFDFETEQEFRDHVGREAIKYARENNLSVDKATEILYNKYTKEAK